MPTIKFDKQADAAEGLRRYLARTPCPANLPAPEPSINNWWLPNVAGAAKKFGVPQEQAEQLVRDAMTRREKNNEVRHTFNRIYGGALAVSHSSALSLDEYDKDLLAAKAGLVPSDIDAGWLRRNSPIDVDDVRPGDYLEAIYSAGERVAVVNKLNEWKPFIWQVRGSDDQHDKLSEYLTGAREGVWYQINPVTGTCINNSWRAEANLTSFRYVLLESDEAPKDLWLRFVVQLRLPVVAIVDSGGKSIHAIVRTSATNAEELRSVIRGYQVQFAPFGLDCNSNRVVQFSRLPRVLRWNRLAIQRLLWLDPSANGKPIYQ